MEDTRTTLNAEGECRDAKSTREEDGKEDPEGDMRRPVAVEEDKVVVRLVRLDCQYGS